jgi:hypothetical protein
MLGAQGNQPDLGALQPSNQAIRVVSEEINYGAFATTYIPWSLEAKQESGT